MNPESDVLRLRDPKVLANQYGRASDANDAVRLPAIRFEAVSDSRVVRSLRCITPAHVIAFAIAAALLALAERFAHPLHVTA